MTSRVTAVIVHGSGGYPGRNWFPWLKGELESRNLVVTVPQFPTPEGQGLSSWVGTFSSQVGTTTPNLVLFGHSTGVALILNLLHRSSIPAKATFLVAGFVGRLNHPVFDPLNESFFTEPFDWARIRRNSGNLFIYAGDDDPYVPLEKGQELARNLGTELTIIPQGGHLNQDSGFKTFPRLLKDFDSLIAAEQSI